MEDVEGEGGTAVRANRPPVRLAGAPGNGALTIIALLATGCGTTSATPEVDLEPMVVTRPSPTPLAPVSFLTGCWRGRSTSSSTVIEERWGPPSANVMLSTTRFLRDGVTVGFEFGHVEAGPDGIVYTPYPGGDRSAHAFPLTSSAPGEALFEAPEHDYPKRIQYRLRSDGVLTARIDGGPDDPSARVWNLQAVSCEGLPAI